MKNGYIHVFFFSILYMRTCLVHLCVKACLHKDRHTWMCPYINTYLQLNSPRASTHHTSLTPYHPAFVSFIYWEEHWLTLLIPYIPSEASQRKLLLQAEEEIEIHLGDAERSIASYHKASCLFSYLVLLVENKKKRTCQFITNCHPFVFGTMVLVPTCTASTCVIIEIVLILCIPYWAKVT